MFAIFRSKSTFKSIFVLKNNEGYLLFKVITNLVLAQYSLQLCIQIGIEYRLPNIDIRANFTHPLFDVKQHFLTVFRSSLLHVYCSPSHNSWFVLPCFLFIIIYVCFELRYSTRESSLVEATLRGAQGLALVLQLTSWCQDKWTWSTGTLPRKLHDVTTQNTNWLIDWVLKPFSTIFHGGQFTYLCEV